MMFYFWFWFLANLTIVTEGGHRRPIELCPTKLSMVSLGYHGRSPWRTCFIISIFLQWDVANPRTTVPICISNCVKPNQTFSFPFHVISVPVRFSQSVHREHVAHFSGRIIDPLLSGFTEVVLHVRCIPQQNSIRQFWASVSLTTPFDMMLWAPRGMLF